MKIAVAPQGSGGLDDTVSPVFARCPVYTQVTATDQKVTGTETMANQAKG